MKYYDRTIYISRRVRKAGETYEPYISAADAAVADEAYALLAEATKHEANGRVREALAAYRAIAKSFPSTSVGRDAQISADNLFKIAGDVLRDDEPEPSGSSGPPSVS